MSDDARRRADARGREAESRAAWLLRLKGYRILGRRLRTPVGEVDLLARRGGVLAVVEVKARGAEAVALASITPRQRERIERASEYLVAQRPEWAALDRRFDVVVLSDAGWPKHVPDAWRPGLA